MGVTIVTGEVRLSYVKLFKPEVPKGGGDPVYSVTILIPKTDVATKQAIDNAIQQTANEALATTFGGYMPPTEKLNSAVHDGDGVRPTDARPYGDECKGCWVISAKSKTKPEVVDANVQPIISQTAVYSGCYGRVSLNLYAYNNGSVGVGIGLGNVQKLRDGEPLGGGTTAKQDFGAPAPQPTQGAAQQQYMQQNIGQAPSQYGAPMPQQYAQPQSYAQPPQPIPYGAQPTPQSHQFGFLGM